MGIDTFEDNDEFGDDDDLFQNVDLDQWEAQAYQQRMSTGSATPGPSTTKRTRTEEPATDQEHSTSLSPSSSIGAATGSAAIPQQEQQQEEPLTKRSKSTTRREDHQVLFDDNINDTDEKDDSYHAVLNEYFGYTKFRPGQWSVLRAIVEEQRDAAVFWSTGKGKSLCFQIPALLPNNDDQNNEQGRVVVVISPLISLMQDQVDKLNGLCMGSDQSNNTKVANYLGSGQTDDSVYSQAMQGAYSLLYVTPETFCSHSFVQQLQQMHLTRKPIALFAVDEAHCVSEWGHDFRPEFRAIGSTLRGSKAAGVFDQIPILALTATAIPRVQRDIVESLHLHKNPLISVQSFDRSNLVLQVTKKPQGGVPAAFRPLLEQWSSSKAADRLVKPTIVYAPTRAQVEEIASFLQHNLPSTNSTNQKPVTIEAYHAGMTPQDRHRIHTNFLTVRVCI